MTAHCAETIGQQPTLPQYKHHRYVMGRCEWQAGIGGMGMVETENVSVVVGHDRTGQTAHSSPGRKCSIIEASALNDNKQYKYCYS